MLALLIKGTDKYVFNFTSYDTSEYVPEELHNASFYPDLESAIRAKRESCLDVDIVAVEVVSIIPIDRTI